MPIRLDREIVKSTSVAKLDALEKLDGTWAAWWYCGIYRNPNAMSQPKALVAFRELSSQGFGDNVVLRRVPAWLLGQCRVGSLWRRGVSEEHVAYQVREFDVSFDEGAWRLVSFFEAFNSRQPPPYPQKIHPLGVPKDRNLLIEFDLPAGGKLVVPCLEFFARCYGRSSYLRRMLMTRSWREPSGNLHPDLYAPLIDPEEDGVWKVKLRSRMSNGDVVFLAHAKYDKFAERAAMSIHSELAAQYDPKSNDPAFLPVTPWHQGTVRMHVAGVPFAGDKSFLGLDIQACSDPDGSALRRYRDAFGTAQEQSEATGDGTFIPSNRRMVIPPTIVDLTGDSEPDQRVETIHLWDTPFKVLEPRRAVIDIREHREQLRRAVQKEAADVDIHSSGDATGTGKGVGTAELIPSTHLPSNGALRDLWDALRSLRERYRIESVEWFTWTKKFMSSGEPEVVRLEAFDKDEPLTTADRNWVYLDTTTRTLRGVLVASIVVHGTRVCFLELERRPRQMKVNKEVVLGEEKFRGMVCVPRSQAEFEVWLKKVLLDIRYERGRMGELKVGIIENCTDYVHRRSDTEQVPGEASVLRALQSVGIELMAVTSPRRTAPSESGA